MEIKREKVQMKRPKALLSILYTLQRYIRYATLAFTTYTAATVDFLPQWHTSLEQPPCPQSYTSQVL